MNKRLRVCMVVNKDDGVLGPSETFLRAHATELPSADVVVLVGNPGYRRSGLAGGPFLLARSAVPIGARFATRSLGLDSAGAQDTRSVARFLKRNRIDLVLAEYGPTAVSVREACVKAAVPLIAHFHGWDAYSLPRRQDVLAAYQALFRDAAAIIAVSRHMVSRLIDLGAPADKVHWNPCGPLVPEIPARPDASPQLFAAVGRFTAKKAPFLTLLSFAKVLKGFPGARMEMVGSGPLLDASRQLARGLGIDHAVLFHGAASHDDVYSLLNRARCFVQHSVEAPDGDCEGTPVAVLEAMATGLPVVASRHTGILDVVVEGETGTLVDEYDTEGMAEGMMLYAGERELAATVGAAARRSIIARWSMELSLSNLRAILDKVARAT